MGGDDGSSATAPRRSAEHPRVGGDDIRRMLLFTVGGSTPAWAGTTNRGNDYIALGAEHRRVDGDDVTRPIGVIVYSGAPPRGRGRHGQPAAVPLQLRSTPAWAGTTA